MNNEYDDEIDAIRELLSPRHLIRAFFEMLAISGFTLMLIWVSGIIIGVI